jgi:hypothetical protein
MTISNMLTSRSHAEKAIMLEQTESLKPVFGRIAGTPRISCHLVHQHTHEWSCPAEGDTPEEAFHASYQIWKTVPKAADAAKIAMENEDLNQRLRDLEQQLQGQESPADEDAAGGDPDPAAADVSPPKMKKKPVRKKRARFTEAAADLEADVDPSA